MYDFTNIELESQKSIFAMPQADSIFVTQALAAAGVEFEAYGWLEIADGKAPVTSEEASLLAKDNPVCTELDAICIIVSNVPKKHLLEASARVRSEPLDADVAKYRAAIAARGDNVPDYACFSTAEEQAFCAKEIVALYIDEISRLLDQVEVGGLIRFSGSLDPAMYAHSDERVVFQGVLQDPITGAIREYDTSQIFVELRVDGEGDLPFHLEDAWPDVAVTTAVPTGRNLVEAVQRGEEYASASPLKRAFLERCAKPGHNLPMMFKDGAPSEEIIQLIAPQRRNGLVCSVFIGPFRSGVVFVNQAGEFVAGPYATLDGRRQVPEGEAGSHVFFNLDDPVVHQALSRDYPEMAEAFDDIKATLDRIWQETANQAGSEIVKGLETGDFSSAAISEDTNLPTDAGLYFPMRGEHGMFMDYDDPEAAPYIEQLRETGWEGQAWVVTDKLWYRERFGDR